jgi:hypothetical protein
MQSVASLSKTVSDLDKKVKVVERQYVDLQLLVNRLQERVFDIDAMRPNNTPVTSNASLNEDKIKALIKEHVDVAIKALLMTHNETSTQNDQSSTTETSTPEIEESSLLPGLDNGSTLFASLEGTNEIIADDFVIEEKKPAAKKPGRKSKKT